MKKFTLEKVYNALNDLNPEITIPEDIAKKAVKAINNMLAVK
jgi:quinolinate synthase